MKRELVYNITVLIGMAMVFYGCFLQSLSLALMVTGGLILLMNVIMLILPGLLNVLYKRS